MLGMTISRAPPHNDIRSAATSDAGPSADAGGANVDAAEVERFSRMAKEWWDIDGKFRPLHQIGPARLSFIRDALVANRAGVGAAAARTGLRVLDGLEILDVGCGGGLISEPLARLGATVTGIDPSQTNIAVAQSHALSQGLEIDYRAQTAEALATQGLTFDAVVCLEVIEHVPDPKAFLAVLATLTRPGGTLVVSTINRTLKAFALAIVGAEYVLRWLPPGTHQWDRFVTPEELTRYALSAGLSRPDYTGLVYEPLRDRWVLGRDTGVNYIAAIRQPAR